MITTTAPLIDIAVEAGYGSHEAFTRAFTRRTAPPPAAWRKKPGHIQIAAPERRPLPPTRQHPAARTRQGDAHGPAARRWSSTTSG